jgi:hypothetical protein
MKEWTNQDLIEYVSKFKDVQREYVLKQILENDLLAKFLGTTEGRLILGNVVDAITSDTMLMVRLCVEGDKKGEISQAALRISTAYNFMYSIAKMAGDGQEHVEKMKKK